MKLTDLDPRWFTDRLQQDGHPVGMTFRCPHCPESGQRLAVAIHLDGTNMDPDPENPQQWAAGEFVWTVIDGDNFENLSLTPSVNAAPNHWHGHITNGQIVGGV